MDPKAGMTRDVLALGDAVIAFEWPTNLDPAALPEVEEWLGLMVRKLKRITAKSLSDSPGAADDRR